MDKRLTHGIPTPKDEAWKVIVRFIADQHVLDPKLTAQHFKQELIFVRQIQEIRTLSSCDKPKIHPDLRADNPLQLPKLDNHKYSNILLAKDPIPYIPLNKRTDKVVRKLIEFERSIFAKLGKTDNKQIERLFWILTDNFIQYVNKLGEFLVLNPNLEV